MRSHTGAYTTFGKGVIDGSAKGHRINATSSTKAEMVGVHESISAILWMRYFLDAQEYPLRPIKVHQDDLGGKQPETNGKASSRKKEQCT